MSQGGMEAPHSIRIGAAGAPRVVFGHGWGRSHRDFIPVAEALAPSADCILLDLPGFGASPRPDDAWDTSDYARHIAGHLTDTLQGAPYIWVGHSFGGRIGLRLGAAEAPGLTGLVIVAGAGVPRQVSTFEQWKRSLRSRRFQALKAQARTEEDIIALERRFGSSDYVASREAGMRDIFVRTISEDQTKPARTIACPTTLIYGARDTETPPEIGRRLHKLIKGSTYIECPAFDHISVLDRGRHQIALAVKEMLAAEKPKESAA